MLLMESYLCYCSVRLGVITVAIFAIIYCFVLSLLFFINGAEVLHPVLEVFARDEQYRNYFIFKTLATWKERSPERVVLLFEIRFYTHIICALLAINGALKLKKWFVLPLACCEFCVFSEIFCFHIVFMIVLKKLINLGVLITLTLAGSFFILFLGYNCATCIAFFQIVSLVKSERYRALYGNDPFHPIVLDVTQKTASLDYNTHDNVENVHVLDTPNDLDIDEQKRLSKLGLWPKPNMRPPQIISVIPVQGDNSVETLKWWQKRDVDSVEQLNNYVAYRHWQHKELMGDVQYRNALNQQFSNWQTRI